MADESGEVRTEKLDPEAEARGQFALAQIRQYPDPVLRMRAHEIDEFDGELGKLVDRLPHLLLEASGRGLAGARPRPAAPPARRPGPRLPLPAGPGGRACRSREPALHVELRRARERH